MSLADGHEVMFRVWMRCGAAPTGNKAYCYIRDVTNATNVKTVYATETTTWELIYGSWINDTGGTVTIRLHSWNAFNDSSTAIWFDDCVLTETGGIYIKRKVMGTPHPISDILSGKRE